MHSDEENSWVTLGFWLIFLLWNLFPWCSWELKRIYRDKKKNFELHRNHKEKTLLATFFLFHGSDDLRSSNALVLDQIPQQFTSSRAPYHPSISSLLEDAETIYKTTPLFIGCWWLYWKWFFAFDDLCINKFTQKTNQTRMENESTLDSASACWLIG